MRKYFILVCIIILVCVIALSACDLADDSSRWNRETDIAVCIDDEVQEYSVEFGKVAHISTKAKEGYYLTGFYTEPKGANIL